jgi:membrane associated rhomboid family serine protease
MRAPPPPSDLLKYPVTGGTILLAIGVTAVSLTKSVDITPLLDNGGIRRGELWRLLSSSLPHANLFHLAFNVYWIWVFGTLIEDVFGHLRTLLVFVLLALVANGSEYALLSGGIGLSGIGYGLFGVAWVLSRRDSRFVDAVDSRTVQLFVVWFFICIGLTVAGYPIGNVAHGVGCLTGALLGWTITAKPALRAVGAGSVLLLTSAALAGATVARPWVNLSKYAGGDFAKDAGDDEAQLGYDALTAQHNNQAVGWYLDAVRMNPREPSFWYNLGIAYQRLMRNADATAAYQRACELSPADAEYQSAFQAMRQAFSPQTR